ncbi:MAG: NAD(P)H-dependent oxidoreductase [Marmoricola sp.]
MTTPTIAIIIGSTRPGRAGEAIATWVHEVASARTDASYELVDLAEFDLDLLNDPMPPGAANRQYASEKTRNWSSVIDRFDGYVFVTPEYNHGVPAAFKNALDVLYPEWNEKTVGFIGYGFDGGTRAIEHWRTIVANVRLQAARNQVSLSMITDFSEGQFHPGERRSGEVNGLLDQLVPLTIAMKGLRSS